MYFVTIGKLGLAVRTRAASNVLWTQISSDQPPSVYKCTLTLRHLSQPYEDWQEAGSILLPIIRDPRKFPLLKAFVFAGCWDKFESLRVPGVDVHGGKTANDVVNASASDSSRLVARDKIQECRRWEESVADSVAMNAARGGDFDTFLTNVSANPIHLDALDSMGNNVWFWALTGGNTRIIDNLLLHNVSVHWLVLLCFAVSIDKSIGETKHV